MQIIGKHTIESPLTDYQERETIFDMIRALSFMPEGEVKKGLEEIKTQFKSQDSSKILSEFEKYF